MKKLSLTIVMAVAVVGSAFAGTSAKTFKDKVVVEPTCKFRDMEFQIDTFYSGVVGTRNSTLGTGSGGGLGLNFFFAKYFGIGWEGSLYSNQGTASWMPVNGNFFVRFPICAINLAPYVMVGGGADFQRNRASIGYGNVGAGVEYRITNNIGLFTDGRYMYGGSGNVANIRGGLRFAF
ncbi:MAG: hypothetical protein WCG76_02705 [Verrucomicrobiota bacterium]